MTAARIKAFITFLAALLIAMIIAFVEGGGVARADTPRAHSDARSDAASAVQNDWEQGSQSRDRTDAAGRTDAAERDNTSDSADGSNSADASNSADHEDEDDDSDTREAQDRRAVV
jgi:hypothetical protein